jgi:uncharacterized protein YdaU (DUF1376 family)
MAKDPAFLFYPGDWVGGTMHLDFECKGAYMELLMCQFNRGHMTKHMIGQVLGQRCGQIWPQIEDKFECEDGKYYNKRLKEERDKRANYVKSRNNNRSGKNQHTKQSGHMTTHMRGQTTVHMENENVNENKDINTNANKKPRKTSVKVGNLDVDEIYNAYPSRCPNSGRALGKSAKDKQKIEKLLKSHSKDTLLSRVQNYLDNTIDAPGRFKPSLKNFSTFLNNIPEIVEADEGGAPSIFDQVMEMEI